jgi:transcriptional regulator with PAS, ATPase and Fis domain
MNSKFKEYETRERRREEQDALYAMCDELWNDRWDYDSKYCLHNEVEMIERERISDALSKTEGNQTKAAKLLNIGRTNLIAKMKKYSFPFISSS